MRLAHHGPVSELRLDATWAGRSVYPFRAYFVDGLLVDTGPPRRARDFEALLDHLGVAQAVNTHHHEDHAGNNALLNRRGIEPWAHPLAVPLLASLPPIQLYRRLTWGAGANSITRPLGAWLETPRHRFQVLHTPGHTTDHVVLLEPDEGWLFAGDLYIADRLKLLRREEDPHALLASIEAVLGCGFDTIFCAHRGVVSGGHAALTRKRDFLGEVRERTQDLARAGFSEQEVARRLLGRADFLEAFSAGDFSRVNLVRAFWPGGSSPPPPPASRR